MISRLPLFIEGNYPVERLSRTLEDKFGVARAILTGRAALGLTAVLQCWKKRSKHCRVALPAAICHEVVVAVLTAGCEPIFCDVSPADGLVTESEWLRARSLGADVAVVVHLYGNAARLGPVRAIFPAPDCMVVDDAAQALGSYSAEGVAGAGGDVGLLSFGPTKQISVGNAALLFRSVIFAEEVGLLLDRIVAQPESVRHTLAVAFRSRLDAVRARLRSAGDQAALGFSGLLEGLQPILEVPLSRGVEGAILRALGGYAEAARVRVAKRDSWTRGIEGTGLQPVGMTGGCVPWRYVCRLPGLHWAGQYRLAESLRAAGMHVSNWYLPAHWFIGKPPGTMPGAETLAREVFQFWLDEEVTPVVLANNVSIVKQQISIFNQLYNSG
jgi:DegT/DnrJ/EryC1/StrS aminotransferase family